MEITCNYINVKTNKILVSFKEGSKSLEEDEINIGSTYYLLDIKKGPFEVNVTQIDIIENIYNIYINNIKRVKLQRIYN